MQTTTSSPTKKARVPRKVGRNPFEKKVVIQTDPIILKDSLPPKPELNPWLEKVLIELPRETVLIFVRAYGFMMGFLS